MRKTILSLTALAAVTLYAESASAQACAAPCFELNGDCICDVEPSDPSGVFKDGGTLELYSYLINNPWSSAEDAVVTVCEWAGGTQIYSGLAAYNQPNQVAEYHIFPTPNPRSDWSDVDCRHPQPTGICTQGTQVPGTNNYIRPSVSVGTPVHQEYGRACPYTSPASEREACLTNAPSQYQLDATVLSCVMNNVAVPRTGANPPLTGTCPTMWQPYTNPATRPEVLYCDSLDAQWCQVRYTKVNEATMSFAKAVDACESMQVWGETPDCTCLCTQPNPTTHELTCTCDPIVYRKVVQDFSIFHPAFSACEAKEQCQIENGGLPCECLSSAPNSPLGSEAFACP